MGIGVSAILVVLMGQGVSAPAATPPQDQCPVRTLAIPEFPYIFGYMENMVEPGSLMEFIMSVTVDADGRPAKVEFVQPSGLRGASEIWEPHADILSTVRSWRFEPNVDLPENRAFHVTFRYRTMLWTTPKAELEPIIEGCTVEVRDYAFVGRFARMDDIPPEYRHLYHDFESLTRGNTGEAVPCERITLDRGWYAATLYRDGRAEYEGRGLAERKGNYTGTVSLWDFGRLCYAIERLGFFEMSSRYWISITHQSKMYLRVVHAGHEGEVEVNQYANVGPPELWILGRAIDGVVADIDWIESRPPN